MDVDEPRENGQPAEVEERRAIGRAVVRATDRRDAAVSADVDDAVWFDRARLDIEQAAAADRDRSGVVTHVATVGVAGGPVSAVPVGRRG